MQTQKPPPVASSASVIYGDSSGFMRFTVIILSILMRNLEIVFKCLQARVGVTCAFLFLHEQNLSNYIDN